MLVVQNLRPVLLKRTSGLKFAPNAIRSLPADRSWWIPAAVLTDSTDVSTEALKRSKSYFREIKRQSGAGMYRFCFTQKQREVSVLFQPYETVAGYASNEFVERKSRFIGHIAPVRMKRRRWIFYPVSEQNIGRPLITYSLIFCGKAASNA